MIIAIDGTSAAGKGTLAKKLKDYFDYAYLDTGALYRAVGKSVLDMGKDPSDEDAAVWLRHQREGELPPQIPPASGPLS